MDKFKVQTLFNSVDYVTGLKQSQGKTKDERVKKKVFQHMLIQGYYIQDQF